MLTVLVFVVLGTVDYVTAAVARERSPPLRSVPATALRLGASVALVRLAIMMHCRQRPTAETRPNGCRHLTMQQLYCTVAFLLLLAGRPLAAPSDDRLFDVLGYVATVRPEIEARTVTGDVGVYLRLLSAKAETIEFDRADLVIDEVRQQGRRLDFDLLPRRVRVHLPGPTARGELRDLAISYHGAPHSGLRFVPERQQVYTVFSTSEWLVCVDAPDDKATFDLRLVLPAGLQAIGTGTLVSEQPGPDGTIVHRFRQERPVSSYLFGFAAGRFIEVKAAQGNTALRYVGEGFSPDELGRAFRDTPDMLDFFTQRAGVAYPQDTYTQVLVASTSGQEAWGFSLLSDAYGHAVLDEPAAISLIAHELAHQWWGNLVTCQDWTHFWLNEGFATFMAAAYDEQRSGREAYLRDIERARVRYEAVREAGGDRSLVFPDWNHPTANDRTIVYQKGAYVLHLLREQIGDDTFWAGIRRYTTTHAGGSVTTDDFRRSMEQSSGLNLSAFFDKWVYLRK
jgi:aminopeptidase N